MWQQIETDQIDKRSQLMVALDLSIAARAYCVAGGVLKSNAGLTTFPRNQRLIGAIAVANAGIEDLMVEFDLAWQAVPVKRFLRTQLDLLSDALGYASPDALRGYGPLNENAAACLATWHSTLQKLVRTSAQHVEVHENERSPEGQNPFQELSEPCSVVFSSHQRTAINSFLQAFSKDLLLLRSYALAGTPPILPVFISNYTREDVSQILACAHTLNAYLETSATAMHTTISWDSIQVEIVGQYTVRAEDSARRILRIASRLDQELRQKLFALYQATQQAHKIVMGLV